MARQFVVQLDNHPGELAQLSRTFAPARRPDPPRACAGTGPLQCMFVTFTDDDAARSVLKGLGHQFIEGEPVMVEIPDEPGSLGDVSQKLADAGVHGDGRDQAGTQARRAPRWRSAWTTSAKAREALGLHVEDCVGCSS